MALTGIDPLDPVPGTRRELIFAQGISLGGGGVRLVLLLGNRTAAGSETLDTVDLTSAIADEQDMIDRTGRRSELYAQYREYVAIDPLATIHIGAVTVSGGVAAACTLTFATNADAATSVQVTVHGIVIETAIASGDTPTTVAANVVLDINSADQGRLQVTATSAIGVVTVTCAQAGPRGDQIIGPVGTGGGQEGVRAEFMVTAAMTVAKGGVIAGTVLDDYTAVIASLEGGEFYHIVAAATATATITSTDNQLGELLTSITTSALPATGKEQVMHAGLVGTQAEATAVGISAAANSVRGFFYHAEDNDRTSAMIAAMHAAVVRSQQLRHPGANLSGYANSDTTPYGMQPPPVIGDRPTQTEVRADLNNGISPIDFSSSGAAFLVRHITSRSRHTAGTAENDYRAREGHITSVVDFAWNVVQQRYNEQKQEFVSDNVGEGKKPIPNTTTPADVTSILIGVIDDLSSGRPLGIYEGPILAPDKVATMKASIVVTKITAGISAQADFAAIEHLNKAEFTHREISPAY